MFLNQLLKLVKESNHIPEPQVVLDRYIPEENASSESASTNADDNNSVEDVGALQEEDVREVPKRQLRTRKRDINYHE